MKRAALVMLAAAALAACGSPPKEPAPETSAKPVVAEAPKAEPKVVEVAPEPSAVPPAPAPEPAAAKEASAPSGPDFREVFPHVRVDAKNKVVQFDGVVPIEAHDENAPLVFLEVVVCTPDTKEHETLVVTEAKASHVHAALLLVGLQPGSPGKWTFENNELRAVAPKGDTLQVTLTYRAADGAEQTVRPEEMIVNANNKTHFGEARPGRWVFAGSQIVSRGGQERYDADGAGTLVGLTTFGSETVAWSEVLSPEAAVEEPAWVADPKATPRMGTPITVTIKRGG